MKFLIQHNLINPKHLLEIKDAIKDYPHEFVGVIPFSNEIIGDEPIKGREYIPYGSTNFINIAYRRHFKGVHFSKKKFTYTEAVKHRNDMLNNELILEADQVLSFFHAQMSCGMNADWFIRPDEDLKSFSGQIIKPKEGYEWLKSAIECASSSNSQINTRTKIVVARPKELISECRVFIVDRKVISASMYRFHGHMKHERVKSVRMLSLFQKLADGWLPNDSCVMDIADVENELKVIEFNCINGSGFYDNNIPAIFDALWKYHN